jgi:hypothetical protein
MNQPPCPSWCACTAAVHYVCHSDAIYPGKQGLSRPYAELILLSHWDGNNYAPTAHVMVGHTGVSAANVSVRPGDESSHLANSPGGAG